MAYFTHNFISNFTGDSTVAFGLSAQLGVFETHIFDTNFAQPKLTINKAAPSVAAEAPLQAPPISTFELSSLLAANGGDGSLGTIFNGIGSGDGNGYSVSTAGDVNGDGFADILIGAPYGDPNSTFAAGESYVIFGTETGFSAGFDLSTLNGSNGFVINGIDLNDRSGFSVSSAGDINGDGYDDALIGARYADPNGNGDAGETYVVFGTGAGFAASLNLSSLLAANGGDGTDGFLINGIAASDHSGISVSSAGDVNGDGFDDVLIGAYGADPNGNGFSGQSYVVFGTGTGFTASLDLSSLLAINGGDGTNGFILNGIDVIDNSGFSVSSAGDINGDGYDDILIGAHQADPSVTNEGETYVVFGSGAGFAASIELSGLNGTNGFVINGISAGERSGYSVSSAGDVNGDGYDDILIGNDDSSTGETYVVFGTGAGFAASFNLSSLLSVNGGDGTAGFIINGITSGDYSGRSVSSAGDVNGDGYDDILIGAAFADPNGTSSGQSYIVFGSGAGFSASLNLSSLDGTNGFIINGIDGGDRSGSSVSFAGDVNGDGFDDILVGAYAASPIGVSFGGETYLIYGSAEFGRTTVTLTPNVDVYTVAGGGEVVTALGDADTLYGGTESDVLNGGDGNDVIAADAGNDIINGNNGNDRLFGQSGNNTMNGGIGNDQLWSGTGADAMDGGDGTDSVYYLLAGAGVTFNIATGGTAGEAAGDTYTNVERFFGSNFGDTITGGADGDIVYALAGDDIINGEGGDDALYGHDGIDIISGGEGADYLSGGNGTDTLNGDAGADILRGEAGDDILSGGADRDRLFGGVDNDTLNGGDDVDLLFGQSGDDTLNGDAGADTLYGGDGIDILNGGADADLLRGDAGADTLNGDAENDRLFGGADDDALNGGDGNDSLWGDIGADTMDGGNGIDRALYTTASSGVIASLATGGTDGDANGDTFTNIENLYGSNFNDTLTGDNNNNLVVGLSGNDMLYGLDGNDRLIGGAGDDTLVGGAGDDILIGQAGADTYLMDTIGGAFGADRISGFEDGVDLIEYAGVTGILGFANLTISQVGGNTLIEAAGITGTILVLGATATDFTSADFIFFAVAEAPTEDKAADSLDDGRITTKQDIAAFALDEAARFQGDGTITPVSTNDVFDIIETEDWSFDL